MAKPGRSAAALVLAGGLLAAGCGGATHRLASHPPLRSPRAPARARLARIPQGPQIPLRRLPPGLRQYLVPGSPAPTLRAIPVPPVCPVQEGACSIAPCHIFVQAGPGHVVVVGPSGQAKPCQHRAPQPLAVALARDATFRAGTS